MLLLTIGLFTGRNTLSGMIPTNTLIMVIAIVALVVSAAMAIPPVRHLVTEKYLPVVKAYARNLVNVLARPKELALGIAGALVLNLATGLGFWAALMAFGYHTNPAETTFIFLLANTLAPRFPLLAVWVPWRPCCRWRSLPWASPPPSRFPLLLSTESPSTGCVFRSVRWP